ncbi:uncharacterized protein CcaverHIS019_0304870 [Cutaneotrichosporon cavernicola]|uniref:Uncharacterized protein n=1 Tax=Cutaneotrichosporon cavernicola TaxID=279322 RepID=A0AA48I6Y0_9TREE|nr:uncharacterized protein CcaverHIS019_0304870 [Cutaneotrichosporon cavernicola]BEI90417.1 hypothetical protein CcaverHIS019_0304870 [Cutaneotrichosporon cavernicola]BEI98192.1 hypothetical protein CcaverHIS631_0304910 [Cutaneotrichosporon cavernicola]BEJ05968.1 hypothetical protein CcaverHIS641_0304900 [Cutaneotrichosporon cavernicola]
MPLVPLDGAIAVNCPNCASCDPSQPACAAERHAAPSRSAQSGGKDKLTLILAIAVPVAVVVLGLLVFVAYRIYKRKKRSVPVLEPAPVPVREVKAKGSLKSVNSTATDGQSSGTHISTLPPYSPSRSSGSPDSRGPPPLPPRHEVGDGVCVGPPDEEEYEDDASSTSSFGAIAPQLEFDTVFTHTHRSLSPVPEERESMMTRNSAYSAPSLRTLASVEDMWGPSAAQQFRDMTLAQWPTTPPPPPPCHPMRARAYSGPKSGPPVVL